MPKDPKQAVVTAKPVDEKRERVNMRYQRRSENEEETDEENGDSARVRSELERKSKLFEKYSRVPNLTRTLS